MGFKETLRQTGERIREFTVDSRELGMREALYQQHLRDLYPEVQLLNPEGEVVEEGLLVLFDERGYWIRLRAGHGYVHSGAPVREDAKIVTKDGRRVTSEVFKELVEAKAGKGYLEERKKRVDSLLQSLDIPDEIKKEMMRRD